MAVNKHGSDCIFSGYTQPIQAFPNYVLSMLHCWLPLSVRPAGPGGKSGAVLPAPLAAPKKSRSLFQLSDLSPLKGSL
jgi:hypothetical protein